MPDTAPAIQTRGLRKEYGDQVAIESLTLDIEPGEVFGFLGPNGAGKSTAVKMLLGLVHPSGGEGFIMARPISDPKCRREVGFLPEDFRFHEWMRGYEFLDWHARLAGVSLTDRQGRIPQLLERTGLTDASRRPLSTYSKGMLQRIGLAQALVNAPRVVFLDEPTSGLDPLGRRMVRDVLSDLRRDGVTVFLNSHFLSEVEITCTRVAFVNKGCVRLITDPHEYHKGLVEVILRAEPLDETILRGLAQWSARVELSDEREHARLYVSDEKALPDIARWLLAQGAALYELTPRRLSLEDLFVDVMEKGEA